jgi:molybdopterin-guanine dinucleotide biosynthesis protein A
MIHSDAKVLLVVPCDAPLISSAPLQKLLTSLVENKADITVAFDGERFHPVFLAVHCRLKTSLQNYLASGERKVQTWLTQHNTVAVDLSDSPEVFTNVNTLTELSELEAATNG